MSKSQKPQESGQSSPGKAKKGGWGVETGSSAHTGNACLALLQTCLCDPSEALVFLGFHFLQFTVNYKEHIYSNPVCMLMNPERQALILEKST